MVNLVDCGVSRIEQNSKRALLKKDIIWAYFRDDRFCSLKGFYLASKL